MAKKSKMTPAVSDGMQRGDHRVDQLLGYNIVLQALHLQLKYI